MLTPEQLTNNIDANLLANLKMKVEGKVNRYGIVMKIIKILPYKNGKISNDSFMVSVKYELEYECLLLSLEKGLEIIGVIQDIAKGIIFAISGPLKIAVLFHLINDNIFKIEDFNIILIENNKKLTIGDHIKISIVNSNNNINEDYLLVVGKLIDMASNEEIKIFNKHEEEIEDQQFI